VIAGVASASEMRALIARAATEIPEDAWAALVEEERTI